MGGAGQIPPGTVGLEALNEPRRPEGTVRGASFRSDDCQTPTSVRRADDMMAEIKAATAEQSTGIDQVNRAVVHIDQTRRTRPSTLVDPSAVERGALVLDCAHLGLVKSVEEGDGIAHLEAGIARRRFESAVASPETPCA